MMKNRDMSDIVTELQGISNNLLVLGNYVEAGGDVDKPSPQTLAEAIWANVHHLEYVIHEMDDYDLTQQEKVLEA